MIQYLVTNQENEFFPNKKIIAGITMHEENPNYIFATYKDILTAKFIQPTLENIENPKFWAVETSNLVKKNVFREYHSTCKGIEIKESNIPTDEQYFNFAALLCMNYIKNKVFKNWILKYMKNEDRSKRTADAMSEKVRLQSYMDIPHEETYLAPTHALINSVVTGNFKTKCSHSAHKMISDSPPTLNVQAFAHAAITMNTEEITKLIEQFV